MLGGKMLGVYRYRHRTEPWNHLGWKTSFKSWSPTVKISISALDLRGGAAQTLGVCAGSGIPTLFNWKVWAASPATSLSLARQRPDVHRRSETLGLHHLKDHKMSLNLCILIYPAKLSRCWLHAGLHSFSKDEANISNEWSKEYFSLFAFWVWSLWNIYSGNEELGPDRYLQCHWGSRLSGDF